jgi:hypothetical protein
MADQERALRLADELQEISKNPWAKYWERCLEAAAELRRLHAVNGELLEALKVAQPYVSAALTNTGSADAYHAERQVDIAIARAEGEKT